MRGHGIHGGDRGAAKIILEVRLPPIFVAANRIGCSKELVYVCVIVVVGARMIRGIQKENDFFVVGWDSVRNVAMKLPNSKVDRIGTDSHDFVMKHDVVQRHRTHDVRVDDACRLFRQIVEKSFIYWTICHIWWCCRRSKKHATPKVRSRSRRISGIPVAKMNRNGLSKYISKTRKE